MYGSYHHTGHTIMKMVQTASLHWHACVGVWGLAVQPNCPKGRVVCGTVYGEMHLISWDHS